MYRYEEQKHLIFSDEGQRRFLKIRDLVNRFWGDAGAFKLDHAITAVAGDCWEKIAHIDRLVELGEIREITGPDVAGQNRVFVSAK